MEVVGGVKRAFFGVNGSGTDRREGVKSEILNSNRGMGPKCPFRIRFVKR